MQCKAMGRQKSRINIRLLSHIWCSTGYQLDETQQQRISLGQRLRLGGGKEVADQIVSGQGRKEGEVMEDSGGGGL